MSNNLIVLKNSSYAKGRKYIVDANDLMTNFKIILDSAGTSSIRDVIEATGQYFNPLVSKQLIDAITQLTLAANYFKDIGRTNEVILDAYTAGYGVPTQYVHNMAVKFKPAKQNTGATTLAFNGASGVPLLTDTYTELPAGTLLVSADYIATYKEDLGAFVLSSTIEDSGSLALQEIRRLVESAGITYSATLEQQLMQAVAAYTAQQTYQCISDENGVRLNNYVLKPFEPFTQLPKYENGMVLRFRPTFNNTLTNPTIQVNGMSRYPLVASDGDTIPVGSISTNFDVVVRYKDEIFYLVSNGLSSLKLQTGPVVTEITNDSSLGDGDSHKIPTEFAVKTYVDAKTNAKKQFAVTSGETDNEGRPAYFEKTDDSVLTVLAGESGKPSYESIVDVSNAVASPNKPDEIIIEDDEPETRTFVLANCFDGDNDTYYETEVQGALVAGQKDPMYEGQYTIMPQFVGATGLDSVVSKVKLLGVSSLSLPRSVFFQYSIDNGTTWQDVGKELYQEANSSGQIITKVKRDIYTVEFNSGEYSVIDAEIIPYVDATNPDLGIADEYDVRCYAYEFTGQTGWQLVNYQFCIEAQSIKSLVVTYADGTSEVITEKAQLTTSGITGTSASVIKYADGNFEIVDNALYSESYTEPALELGRYWVKLGGTIETFVDEEIDVYAVVETKADLNNYDTSELNNNDVIKVITDSSHSNQTTYYRFLVETNNFSYIGVENTDSTIKREAVKYVRVGTVTLSNGVITAMYPAAFNGEYVAANLTLSTPLTINHNIGSLNSAKMFITCVGSDGGYTNGDTVELTTQAIESNFAQLLSVNTTVENTDISIAPLNIGGVDYGITYSPNPHGHTATSTVSASGTAFTYRVVSSGLNSANLRYNKIILPNKNNGNLFAITPAKWKLSVFCSRSF